MAPASDNTSIVSMALAKAFNSLDFKSEVQILIQTCSCVRHIPCFLRKTHHAPPPSPHALWNPCDVVLEDTHIDKGNVIIKTVQECNHNLVQGFATLRKAFFLRGNFVHWRTSTCNLACIERLLHVTSHVLTSSWVPKLLYLLPLYPCT